jgi:hypothetical protein
MLTRPKKSASLQVVANDKRRLEARETRRMLFVRCRTAIEEMGDDIAGFALVVWDKEGHLRSAYDTTRGPIRAPLMPTLVGDALNRHVAVCLVEERLKNEG